MRECSKRVLASGENVPNVDTHIDFSLAGNSRLVKPERVARGWVQKVSPTQPLLESQDRSKRNENGGCQIDEINDIIMIDCDAMVSLPYESLFGMHTRKHIQKDHERED